MTVPDSPAPISALEEALAACASEPIHAPGGIQALGTLLAIGPDGAVAYCGANVAEYLGLCPDEVIGRPLVAILPQAARALDELSDGPPRHFGTVARPAPGPVELYAHQHAGVRFVELVRTATDSGGGMFEGRLASALAQLAPHLEDECTPRGFAGHVVESARELTGYDWVMVYQFDALWNGEVIAERRPPHLEPFLGLWFPASDIPPQARDLYLRVRTRVLMDARAAPIPVVGSGGTVAPDLDLSFAVLRAVSPVHREYLGNMGVRASLVASVVVHGQLWGMLVCHHPTPRVPSPAAVQILGALARFLASKVALTEDRERFHGKALAQRLLATLSRDEIRRPDLVAALTAPPVGLMELMRADGFLVTHRARVGSQGRVPPTDFVRRLVDRLEAGDDELFATDRLAEVEPALGGEVTAAGVLALRIPNASRGWVLWFRPEAARVVRWGGDPDKKLIRVGGAPRLTPRASFEAWRAEIRGRSMAWSRVELGMAEDTIRHSLVESLARSFQRQAEEFSRYHAILFEQVNDAVVVADPSGTVTFWNAGAARTLGWSPEEMIGRPVFERFSPDDRRAEADRFARALAGEEVTGTFADTHKDGHRVWLNVRLRRVEDESGHLLGAMSVGRDVTAQRELEEKLRLSDAIIRHAQDSVLVTEAGPLDQPGPRILYANPAFLTETGYALDEILGKSPRFLQGPKSAREPLDRIRAALARGEEIRVELTNHRKDGTSHVVDLEITPLKDATGRVTHFFSIQRDISAHQKALESALRTSEARFRAIFHAQFQFIGLMSPDGTLLEANRGALALIGLSERDVCGRLFWETPWWVHDPDQRDRLRAAVLRAANGEPDRFETHHPTADGRQIWVDFSLTPFRDDSGAVAFLIPEGRDVTERKRAEEALCASEEQYRTVVQALAEGVVVQDRNGAIVTCNRRAPEILGLTPDQITGRTSLDPRWRAVREDGSPFAGSEHPAMVALRTGRAQDNTLMGVHTPAGELRWITINAVPLPNPNPSGAAVVVSFHDVTAIRTANDLLRASLREKELMFKEIHHRVKNNLAITISLFNSQMRGLTDGPVRGALRQAQDRVRSMALVHEMLYQSESLSAIDLPGYLTQLVQNLSSGYALGGRVKTVFDLTPVALALETAIPFGLIVNELVSNAFKYAYPDDRRGTLAISLRPAPAGEITLTVRDDGVGLPAGLDPFTTRSLGLRLVRDLARQIGGTVAVERAGGAAFVLSFPTLTGDVP